MDPEDDPGYASTSSTTSTTSSTTSTSEPLLKYRRVKASVVDILNGTSPSTTTTSATSSTSNVTPKAAAPVAPSRPPDAVTCAHLHPTALFLGTQSGNLYVLDHLGNLLLHLPAHTARINRISTDNTGTRVATCADDGKVLLLAIPTTTTWSAPDLTASSVTTTTTSYGRPMLSVAVDPLHATKRERVFVSGSVDGRLRVNKRGWFTSNDTVLHEGEGPVQCVQWTGSLVAWANDYGVKLYDYDRHQRISYIERPRPRMASTRAFDVRRDAGCCMHWEIPEKKLLVGWGDCWMVVQITTTTTGGVGGVGGVGGASGAGPNGGPNGGGAAADSNAATTTTRCAEIVALHYTQDYVVSGICTFGDDVALLAFVPPEEVQDDESSDEDDYDARPLATPTSSVLSNNDTSAMIRVRPSRPELRIVDRQTGEQLSCDMLPVYGFSKCGPRDYSLVSDQGSDQFRDPTRATNASSASSASSASNASSASRASNASTTSSASSSSSMAMDYTLPSLYIVSPKDIVVASPRNVEDHIKWALEHDQYDQALEIAEHAEPPLSKERLQNLAER